MEFDAHFDIIFKFKAILMTHEEAQDACLPSAHGVHIYDVRFRGKKITSPYGFFTPDEIAAFSKIALKGLTKK